MKTLLFVLAFCFLAPLAKSQELRGHVVDEKGAALTIANVSLLNTDSIFVCGATTDEQGLFKLVNVNKNKYILKVQSIGYETSFRNVDIKQSLDVGTIMMKSIAYNLQDVQIIGKAPIVKREADRVVFDAKQIAGAINVADLLNVTPGVIINGDDVSMFGAQGVKFYMNGKEQRMGSKEMLQILKSYPASDIDKIELITSPSAKYSAEGKAGIINIKLKKKENNFVGGSLAYAHTQYEEEGDEVNANVNYNKGKISSSVNIGGNWMDTPYKETNTQTFTETIKSSKDYGLKAEPWRIYSLQQR